MATCPCARVASKDQILVSASSRTTDKSVGQEDLERTTVPTSLREKILSEASVAELRIAYERKSEFIEKNLVETRYKRAKTDSERKEQSAEIARALRGEIENGRHYEANANVLIGGKSYSVRFLFHYYNGGDYNKPLTDEDLDKNEGLTCWFLNGYFSELVGRKSIGVSSCVGYLAKRKDHYYVTTTLNLDELEPHMPYLAVGIPVGTDTFTRLEGLDSKTSTWAELDRLNWERVSEARFKDLENQLIAEER
jgi:hypothetical protein